MEENNGSEMGRGLVVCSMGTVTGQIPTEVEAPLHAQALSTKNVLHGQDLSSPIQLHGCGEGHVTHNDEQGGTGESQFIFVAGGSGTPTASSLSDQCVWAGTPIGPLRLAVASKVQACAASLDVYNRTSLHRLRKEIACTRGRIKALGQSVSAVSWQQL
ncbi:hypothetical protein ACOSQ2_007727 [Xanthoceras sorbifolium]